LTIFGPTWHSAEAVHSSLGQMQFAMYACRSQLLLVFLN